MNDELRELLVARMDEAMSHHSDSYGVGRCDCGHADEAGIGLHQLEQAADEAYELLRDWYANALSNMVMAPLVDRKLRAGLGEAAELIRSGEL